MGCFRTFDDMKLWRRATRIEKLDILKRAKERRGKHKRD